LSFLRSAEDTIDLEIERSLQRVVLEFELDRSTLYQVQPNGVAHISHQWVRPGLPRTPLYANVIEVAPWATAKVMSGQTIQFSRLGDLPPEAALDRKAYDSGGNKSNVTVPVKLGENVVGGVAFGTIRSEREWSPAVVRSFQLTGQVFGFALERKKTVADFVRLRDDLDRAVRVASLGELAASLAYELDQPLNAILHAAQTALRLLPSEGGDLEEVRNALQSIVHNDRLAAKTSGSVRRLFKRARREKPSLPLSERFAELERLLRNDATVKHLALGFEDEVLVALSTKSEKPCQRLPTAGKPMDVLKRLHGSLTSRERQVFALVAAGLSSKQIGKELGIAEKTTKVHRAHAMEKMEAGSLAELVRIAARLGI
jgi:DNA-binding CsgD family transcriptional regulator/GAF domain-containing protein